MSTCKDVCKKFRAIRPVGGIGRYEIGQKRCNHCGIFINFNGSQCPCCACRLRITPKSAKCRKRLRIAQAIYH